MSRQAPSTAEAEIFAQKGQAAPSVEKVEADKAKTIETPHKQPDLPFLQEVDQSESARAEPPPAGSLLSIDFRRLTDSERGQILSLKANKLPFDSTSRATAVAQPPLSPDIPNGRPDAAKSGDTQASGPANGGHTEAETPRWRNLKELRDKEVGATSEADAPDQAPGGQESKVSILPDSAEPAAAVSSQKTTAPESNSEGESTAVAAPLADSQAVASPAISDPKPAAVPLATAPDRPTSADSVSQAAASPAKPSPTKTRLPIGLAAMIAVGLIIAVGLWNVGNFDSEPLAPTPVPAVVDTAPPVLSAADSDAAQSGRAAPAQPADPTLNAPQASATPSFDLIRVEPNGEAVLAGRAKPNSSLIILDNGTPLGTVKADSAGEWAFIPDQALPPGDHAFALVVSTPQGEVTLPARTAEPESQPTVLEEAVTSTGEETAAGATAPASDELRSPLPKESLELEGVSEDLPQPVAKPPQQRSGLSPSKLYGVQLSSTTSEQAALREWKSLQDRFPNLLGDKNLDLQKAVLQDGVTRYRVRTTLVSGPQSARKLCDAFRAQNQDCLVFRD